MNKKQALRFLLLTAALLCMLTACGSKPAQTPAPEPEPPVQEEPKAEAPTETPAEVPEETPEEAPEEAPEEVPEETPADTPEVPAEPEPVDLTQVRDAIIDGLEIAEPFLLDTDALLNLYGIEGAWVAQSASFATMSGTFPDEVVLVEALDEAAAASVAQCLQSRLDEVLVQSKSYDADNYAAAQACQVRCDGLYVSLLLSPKQAEMTEICQRFLGSQG